MPFVDNLAAYIIGAFIVGVFLAEYNAIRRRQLNRGNLGIEAMYKLWKDEKFRAGVVQVMKIPRETIAKYAISAEELGSHAEREKREIILETINYFETLATGANMGIYSRKVLGRLIRAQTVRVYVQVLPFLEALRQQSIDYRKSGKEFEKLVNKWGGKQRLKSG